MKRATTITPGKPDVKGSDEAMERKAVARSEEKTGVPAEIDDLEPGEVLHDRRRKEWFVVIDIEDRGTRLRQDDDEFFVPHSLLAPWVDSRLFAVEESDDVEFPEWV